MGVPVAARNIFPSNIQGLPTWYEVRVVEDGWRGRRGGVDLDGGDEPADMGEGRRGDRCRAAGSSTTRPSRMPPSKFRDDVTSSRPAADRDLQRRVHRRAAAAAVQEHHLPRRAVGAARHRRRRSIEGLFGEQYKGKEALLESNRKAFRMGRDAGARSVRVPAADPRAPRANASASASSSTATARRRWAACTAAPRSRRGIRSRRRRRSPRRSRRIAASSAPTPTPAGSATRSCRPRTSSRRSAW